MNFSKIIPKLAEASGKALPEVIDFEMGKILEACVKNTPAAKVDKLVDRAGFQLFGNYKIGTAPKRPFKGALTKNGFKTYFLQNRYPDEVWQEISAKRIDSLQKKLARRGLSKRSWLRLAELLGLEIKTPAFVKKAKPPISDDSENFKVTREKQEGVYSLWVRNEQPTINVIGGNAIARRAIAGRVKYFEENLKKGVFNRLTDIARAYPGLIKVTGQTGSLTE